MRIPVYILGSITITISSLRLLFKLLHLKGAHEGVMLGMIPLAI